MNESWNHSRSLGSESGLCPFTFPVKKGGESGTLCGHRLGRGRSVVECDAVSNCHSGWLCFGLLLFILSHEPTLIYIIYTTDLVIVPNVKYQKYIMHIIHGGVS